MSVFDIIAWLGTGLQVSGAVALAAHERHIELIKTWDAASPTERQELDRLRRGWGPSTPTERMARRTDLQAAMRSIEDAMTAVLPDEKGGDDLTIDHFQTAYDALSKSHRGIIALLHALPELSHQQDEGEK